MSSSLSKQTCLSTSFLFGVVLGIIFKRRTHNHIYSAILNPRTHKTMLECLSISLKEGQPSEAFVRIMEFKAFNGEGLCISHSRSMDVEENWEKSIPLRIFPKCKKCANGLFELGNFLFDNACCL